MQIKTAGVVLHTTKYSESAAIVTIYTREFGRISYMVYGINKKKATCRAALLQPLSMVELDVFHQPGKEIQRIKDIRVSIPMTGIPFHPAKNAIALFISEILFRTLKQTDPDEQLFAFLENAVQMLDCCDDGIANFHLVFLLKMSRYLGFEPNNTSNGNDYFDLMNGEFLDARPPHSHYMTADASRDFGLLLQSDFTTLTSIQLSREKRRSLLDSIVEYYRLHVPGFFGIHSLDVLHSLFN